MRYVQGNQRMYVPWERWLWRIFEMLVIPILKDIINQNYPCVKIEFLLIFLFTAFIREVHNMEYEKGFAAVRQLKNTNFDWALCKSPLSTLLSSETLMDGNYSIFEGTMSNNDAVSTQLLQLERQAKETELLFQQHFQWLHNLSWHKEESKTSSWRMVFMMLYQLCSITWEPVVYFEIRSDRDANSQSCAPNVLNHNNIISQRNKFFGAKTLMKISYDFYFLVCMTENTLFNYIQNRQGEGLK